MSGIGDLEQSAKNWLADVLENLAALVRVGYEPSMDLELFGAEFEIRLKPKGIEAKSENDS